jgi:hypothetical protein
MCRLADEAWCLTRFGQMIDDQVTSVVGQQQNSEMPDLVRLLSCFYHFFVCQCSTDTILLIAFQFYVFVLVTIRQLVAHEEV